MINLRKNRYGIMVGLLLAFIPFLFKFSGEQLTEKDNKPLVREFLSWPEVNKIFLLYDEATITDLDTRLSFRVQRRDGSNHADVQPLTAQDTAVMKQIYNGKWCWKRKAVIVTLNNGQRIAGSIHGMPHGPRAIQGNQFNGHFCIHFKDSLTHGSRKVDLSHQIMVWKAANQLETQLSNLDVSKVIRIFLSQWIRGIV